MTNNALQELDKEWEEFNTEFTKAETEHLAYLGSYRQLCAVQNGCSDKTKHLKYVLKQLGQDIDSLLRQKGLSEEDKVALGAKKAQASQIRSKLAEMQRELPAHDNG
uniref:GTP-binding protein n=1 Tax=Globodera pallida TaxID=36090 RepID=A0A183BTC5_GLOPA